MRALAADQNDSVVLSMGVHETYARGMGLPGVGDGCYTVEPMRLTGILITTLVTATALPAVAGNAKKPKPTPAKPIPAPTPDPTPPEPTPAPEPDPKPIVLAPVVSVPTPELVIPPPPPDDQGWWAKLVPNGGKISFYGMLRVDSHYTDNAMNDPRFPMWALSTGNHTYVAGQDRVELNKNPTFVMHPRLSRFGLDAISKPIAEIGHPILSGKLEFDFFAGENESRALPRLRHGYGKIQWGAFYTLFGQTSDVISPLNPSVNNEAVMWNTGNLGDRQPQIQLGFVPKVSQAIGLEFQAAAGQEGARTNADIDKDGILDGDLAARPQLQGRAGVVVHHGSAEPITIGGWSVLGRQRLVLLSTLPNSVSPKTNFKTFAAGADFSIPIASFLKIQGELWQGLNLADLRGGIGQVTDIRTGTEVRSKGGWVELLVKPVAFWRIAAGAGIDSPNQDDVNERGQRSKNQVIWLGDQLKWGAFALNLDYARWHTEWVRLNTGIANRYSVSLVFTF